MRPAVPMVAVVAAATIAALATFGLTRGEQGKVIGSQHDLGVTSGAGYAGLLWSVGTCR